ncbi:single-stranded-DNA-specific exonuclease RecJ [Methylovirgula sp. 4M-Z18]|uniref:single-stranded-DNA-specific exonuclease RecJ n=1 Tax=Methylovirgula sp. 4M-Z18 TaxID=2293567 RepID=UPI000E2E86BE|nr:single-stranded-DNA-specific exonuclease RecJ [Methylovirgula sp. 4M-Z18]RFB80966.1 single-stranded-DNA-specific exonuclease RecJ [Methylovirgula sp. 4M-Z18]
MSERKPLLGVDQSVSQRAWRDRLDIEGAAQAMALAQGHGLSDILARVLVGRGVTMETVEDWLDPSLRNLMPDPDVLTDMQPAVARLAQAAQKGETVAVFGDYDVDGATATALLANFLNACGCNTIIHIPDRIFEGYGPNSDAIASLHARGATLLVTVDCGTTSFEPLAAARLLGLDAIVLDHHQAPEVLPEAVAIVNPNRQDDLSQLGYLCAAGVVFMTLVGLNRALRDSGFWTAQYPAPALLSDLDLVALGTVADVVPLIGLNRAFVTRGLQVMKARGRIGLTALMDAAGAHGPARPYHLGFLVGPRINAGGRIGDAALGARLLMTDDPVEAGRVAAELDRLNRERQAIEVATLEEADAMASQCGDEAVLMVGSDAWHPGVVGLVASRLKDRYRRPAFAISFTGDIGTGSGRSIAGVDLGRAVRAAVETGLLVKGGGHAMAAGLTVERGKLESLRAYLSEALGADVTRARAEEALRIDGMLTATAAQAALVKDVERAGPFGTGNSEPIFAFADQRMIDVGEVGQGHIRVRTIGLDGGRLQAIAFRAAASPLGQALLAGRGTAMHLAGTLSIDHWGGQERVQLRILDAAPAGRRQA